MSEELVCDHTSVGVIAHDDLGRVLLIERNKFPFGWASPSGHCDGDSYPMACFKEFEEETGLKVLGVPEPIYIKNPKRYFKCRRGGEYHYWQIFQVKCSGKLAPSVDETKRAQWCSAKAIEELAEKTRTYLGRMRALSNPAIPSGVTCTVIEALEKEWQANPGLEPVWCEFFTELGII